MSRKAERTVLRSIDVVRDCTCTRMWIFKINNLAFVLLISGQYNTFALQDVTAELFGSVKYGTVAAFGDFNSDKQTDIFIIRERTFVVHLFVYCSHIRDVTACSQFILYKN